MHLPTHRNRNLYRNKGGEDGRNSKYIIYASAHEESTHLPTTTRTTTATTTRVEIESVVHNK